MCEFWHGTGETRCRDGNRHAARGPVLPSSASSSPRGLPGPASPPSATRPAPHPAHQGRRRPRSDAPGRTRARPRRRVRGWKCPRRAPAPAPSCSCAPVQPAPAANAARDTRSSTRRTRRHVAVRSAIFMHSACPACSISKVDRLAGGCSWRGSYRHPDLFGGPPGARADLRYL